MLLDAANAFKDKLFTENRQQSLRIMELESEAKYVLGCSDIAQRHYVMVAESQRSRAPAI